MGTADEEVPGVHVWRWVAGLSLTHGPVHVVLLAAALAALAGPLTLRRSRARWLRRVSVAAAVTALLVAGVRVTLGVTRPWPDPLPISVYAWIGVGVLALVLLALGWRRQPWRTRALAVAGVLLAVLGAADGVDAVFGSFPTVATALQLAPYDRVPAGAVLGRPAAATASDGPLWQTWHPPADLPATGAVTQVDIPATRSGFPARPAAARSCGSARRDRGGLGRR